MAQYDERFKLSVVQEYLGGALGFKALASKHGIDESVVRQWVGYYEHNGVAGLRKKSSRYTASFKLSVLRHMWRQELSCRQAAVMFDLRGGAGVVSGWARLYDEGGLDALKPKPRGRPKKMKTHHSPVPSTQQAPETRTVEDLRKENEYLRAEVAYLKKLDALVRAKKLAAQPKRKP